VLDFKAHTNILHKLKTICLGRLTWFTLIKNTQCTKNNLIILPMLGAGKIGCVLAADQTNYLDFHLWGLTQRTVLMAPPSIRRKNSLNSREVPHSASIPITSFRVWKNLRHLKKFFCRRLRIDACFNFKCREIQPTCWSAWFNKIQTVLGCKEYVKVLCDALKW